MKILNYIKKFFKAEYIVRYKSMSSVIALCIFIIFSFLLGIPMGANKVKIENDILNNYNYQVLREIPTDNTKVNATIKEVINKECSVIKGYELSCEAWDVNEAYESTIEFNVNGITKRITIVLDIFDFEQVYLGSGDDLTYYSINRKFKLFNENDSIEQQGYYIAEENVENYLLVLATDALYFQAHPFGTNKLNNTNLNGVKLREESIKVFYQNNLPNFSINSESFEDAINSSLFGEYIMDQILIGNDNVIKLKSFTLAFIICVFFTFITVLILWVFYRKTGKLTKISEYYNLAAISSLPIFIIFFILLWFNSDLIYLYIFVFSLNYLIMVYLINSKDELV